MKFTLNIDDTLLDRVMVATGAKTKTDAIHYALAEVDRRHRLKELLAEEIALSASEWRNAFDTASDVEEPPQRGTGFQPVMEHSLRVAETPASGHDR